MQYIEIAVGTPSNRGKIIKMSQLGKEILKARANNDSLYKSYYSFDEEILKHFEIYKSISSFKGKFYLDRIIIDIDKGKRTDQEVWLHAKEFLNTLEDEWQLDREQIGIWYSGTGYHFSFPDIFHFEPAPHLPNVVKATLTKYFPIIDYKPLIPTGLIRVGYTINKKNGLYKIPITYDEFLEGVTKIKLMAQEGKLRNIKESDLPIPNHFDKQVLITDSIIMHQEKIDSNRIITCVQKIFNEGALEGSRHVNLIRLVSVRKRNGNSFDETMAIAKIWNDKNNQGLTEKELTKQVKYIWSKGYTPSCNDDVLKQYCDKKCIYFENKNLVTIVETTAEMEIKFIEKVRNPNRMILNFNESLNIPKYFEFNIEAGQVMYLIGDTGTNKSALAQNFATHFKNMNVLYINNEVDEETFYRRFIQIDNNMTKEDVENYYKEHNNTLSDGIKHIHLINQKLDLYKLNKIIVDGNYNILIIDVIGKLLVKNKIGNDKIEAIADEIREITNRHKIITLGIHHISKSAAVDKNGNPTPLNVHSGMYSATLEQSADIMLGISGDRKQSLRLMQYLKARDATGRDIRLAINPQTFRFDYLEGI